MKRPSCRRKCQISLPVGGKVIALPEQATATHTVYEFSGGCQIRYQEGLDPSLRPESFRVGIPSKADWSVSSRENPAEEDFYGKWHADEEGNFLFEAKRSPIFRVPAKSLQIIPGSSWGTFTIFCTIPIALFVGLWMYRIRIGRIVEASIIGGIMVLVSRGAGSVHSRLIAGTDLQPDARANDSRPLPLRLYGGGLARLAAADASRLSIQLHEDRHPGLVDRGSHPRQSDAETSAAECHLECRRTDLSGRFISLRLHLCDVWGNLRLSCPRRLRDDAKDDRQGERYPHHRLRGHADRRAGRTRCPGCGSVDADGNLLPDQCRCRTGAGLSGADSKDVSGIRRVLPKRRTSYTKQACAICTN